MITNQKSISIVLPAFNEEINIVKTVSKIINFLSERFNDWEIIVVNDGSFDNTGKVCDNLAKQTPQVRAFHHPKNRGYGAALKTGISNSRKEMIFFTDSDGQFDFTELPLLLEHIDSHDIVSGYRKNRKDPPIRSLNAWGWNKLVTIVLGLRVKDIDCAFKLFNRRVFESVQIESVGAMVNTEILCQAKHFNMSLKELPVTHLPREHGTQTGANFKVIVKAFRELLILQRKLKNTSHDQEGLFKKDISINGRYQVADA